MYNNNYIYDKDFLLNIDFDKIRKELTEKYKLTPIEETHNKAVELGKKWGTNPNGKKITLYTKALEANDENARLLFDESVDEGQPLSLRRISNPLLDIGTITISNCIKMYNTAEEFKNYLKEQNVKIEDLNEKDINVILDTWPDFFEGEELSEIKESDDETRIPFTYKLFTTKEMNPSNDTIKYTNLVWTKEAEKDLDAAFNTQQTLMEKIESDPNPEKPEKISWKKQQRMRKSSPMWKPTC